MHLDEILRETVKLDSTEVPALRKEESLATWSNPVPIEMGGLTRWTCVNLSPEATFSSSIEPFD